MRSQSVPTSPSVAVKPSSKLIESLRAKGVEMSVIAEPLETVVDCREGRATSNDFEAILAVESLKWLSVAGCPITNELIRSISADARLEYLDIGDTNVDGTILKHLATLKSLQGLRLSGIAEVAKNLHWLYGNESLEELDLSGTDVGIVDVKVLLVNSHLKGLNLQDTCVIAEQLRVMNAETVELSDDVIVRDSDGEVVLVEADD